MQRRTRRSAPTIGGATPDTIIGRAAADRAGARSYRATRCENASKCAMTEAPLAEAALAVAIPNPEVFPTPAIKMISSG